ASIKWTVQAPSIDRRKTKGRRGPINFKSILPALKNVKELVKFPIEAASLLVAMALAGERPTNINAGSVIKAPPPTIALIKEPKKPKKISNIPSIKSSSIFYTPKKIVSKSYLNSRKK